MRTHQYPAILLVLALIGQLSPAFAQRTETDTSSRIAHAKPADIPEGKMSEGDRARVTLNEFGECVVGRHRAPALAAIAFAPGSIEGNAALAKLADNECLRAGSLKFTSTLMRGAVYRAFYRQQYSRKAGELIAEPIDLTKGPAASPEGTQVWGPLYQFADCVVRRDMANARNAVLAPVASEAETAAYAALAPHFSACLTQGGTVKFTKAILGGLLAEVLYRDSIAAGGI